MQIRLILIPVVLALAMPATKHSEYQPQERGQTLSVDVDPVNVVYTVFDTNGRCSKGWRLPKDPSGSIR